MVKKKSPYYTIGLGQAFLRKSRLIFSIIFTLLIVVSVSAVYVGASTGELYKQVFEPAKQVLSNIYEAWNSSGSNAAKDSSFTATSSSKIWVEINTQRGSSSGTQDVNYYEVDTTFYPTIDYSDGSDFDVEQWWQRAQEENAQKSEESKRALEEFRAESEQKLDGFKALSEKCAQEFRDNEGQFVSEECLDR